jgi:hypothetical protein
VFQLFPESLVLGGEVADARVGNFEAAYQGCIGGTLRRGQWCADGTLLEAAEPADLGADVVLGVEPGPRDVCLLRDDLEGDCSSLAVEVAKSLGGFGTGGLVAPLGGGDQVVAVIGMHQVLASSSWSSSNEVMI